RDLLPGGEGAVYRAHGREWRRRHAGCEQSLMHRLLTAILVCLIATGARGDVFRPAYLELRESGNGEYDVLWKVPVLGDDLRLAAYVVFPQTTERLTDSRIVTAGGAWIERWRVRQEGGLVG